LPDQPPDVTRYKVRIETETTVKDGPALAAIFEQLGYTAAFVYEKFRTEWSHVDPITNTIVHLVIDETPIGNYAELEGPPDWIDRTLAELDIDQATCLTDSYGKLFLDWKERTGSPAENLTFADIFTPALATH
jgi:adenylate cyclase class 2